MSEERNDNKNVLLCNGANVMTACCCFSGSVSPHVHLTVNCLLALFGLLSLL